MFDALLPDLRYAARTFTRRPGFAVVAVGILATGIWAATTIITVVNAVVLRGLPYPDAERLVVIYQRNEERGSEQMQASMPIVRDWIEYSETFDSIGVTWTPASMILAGNAEPRRITASLVSPAVLELLGVRPAAGRIFGPEDHERPGEHRVAILSYDFWQQQLAGDPDVIGRSLRLNGAPYAVVGVLPRDFADFPYPHQETDVWVPVMMVSQIYGVDLLDVRTSRVYAVLGRLSAGATLEQARVEMAEISNRLAEAYPESDGGWTTDLVPLEEVMLGTYRAPMLGLVVGAGLLLLIGCANVANLLLVHASGRRKELSVRVAIGASRARLLRQPVTETFALVATAGVAGVVATVVTIDLIVASSPISWPRFVDIRIDGTVVALTLFVAGLTTLTTAVVAAAPTLRSDPVSGLHGSAKGHGSTRGGGRLRRVLVVGEVAVAAMLLVGAGLMVRSLDRLQRTDIGFEPENLMAMQLELPTETYEETEVRVLARQLTERLGAVPGVDAAFLWSPMVPGQSSWFTAVRPQDQPDLRDDELPLVRFHYVGPGAIEGLGLRLISGRGISEIDDERGPGTIVLSRSAADALWPGQDPVGKIVRRWNREQWLTVVGWVEDSRQGGRQGPDTSANLDVYFSLMQEPQYQLVALTRTRSNPDLLTNATREAAQEVAANIPVFDVASMASRLAEQEAIPRFTAFLSSAYGTAALVLATVGLYSVLSYAVRMRYREIGLRMALGARAGIVLRHVVGEGLALAALGVCLGLGAAFGLTRWLETLLYEVSPADPLTYAGVPVVLLLVAATACFVPAVRATRVDATVALRSD